MEGRGVTSYATDKPSFGFSRCTTEFDDELIKRGIVDMEQVLVGKGASVTRARQLVEQHNNQSAETTPICRVDDVNSASSDDDDSYQDSDDEFLEKYRAMRLSEMKQESLQQNKIPTFGDVITISRPEWTREVNESSRACWAIVVLTSGSNVLSQLLQKSIHEMAHQYPHVKFVEIPSKSAIPNWPDANLPTLFCYRHGKLQHELVRMLQNETTVKSLRRQFVAWEIVGSSRRDEQDSDENDSESATHKTLCNSRANAYHGTAFGGTMSKLSKGQADEETYNEEDW